MSKHTKLVYPNYYPQFSCIADKCKHSCCVGWQIEIDKPSLERYCSIDGQLGSRIKSCIDTNGKAHFVLDEKGKCPFLNSQGLCDIISELGEQALCDICKNHPRFFNSFWSCDEVGLGLCCEEACRLILHAKQPFELINFSLDNYSKREKRIVKLRQGLIEIMQNRSLSLLNRHSQLLQQLGHSMPNDITVAKQLYLGLEALDAQWRALLTSLEDMPLVKLYDTEPTQSHLEQLTVYFLYRHVGNASTYEKAVDMAQFSILSTQIIMWLLQCNKQLDILELARMYSTEIEYSTVNISRIVGFLHKFYTK